MRKQDRDLIDTAWKKFEKSGDVNDYIEYEKLKRK